jgi:hypothetical protein
MLSPVTMDVAPLAAETILWLVSAVATLIAFRAGWR